MKYTIGICFFVILLIWGPVGRGIAQTNVSPYSFAGIGDLNSNNFDRSTGMANSGISLSSGRYLYMSNPASFGYLDNNWFTGELSANYKYVNYSGNPITSSSDNHSADMQFQKLAFGIKANKYWGIGFGLKQFSSSNYNYQGTGSIGNAPNITFPITYEGSGGLNQFFWTNSIRLTRGLSLGLESSYIFGSMQKEETIAANSIITSPLNITQDLYYHKVYFKAGVQYQTRLSDNWQMGVGATASRKTTLNGKKSVSMTEGDLSASGVPTSIISDSAIATSRFTLPLTVGAGLSLKYKNKYTFAADYQRQDWNGAGNTAGIGFNYLNAQRFSAGFEYASKQTVIQNGQLYSFERFFFQAGGYYTNGYIQMRGQQINDYGATLGLGVNAKSTPLGCMLNLQVGSRGTEKSNLIRENYVQFGVSLTYRDFWNSTKRIFD